LDYKEKRVFRVKKESKVHKDNLGLKVKMEKKEIKDQKDLVVNHLKILLN
jgi:hypothetical protein